MKHLGDITKISGHNVPIVDVVTGGSPCQDLSVAGKRAGLDGERSGLFMEQIRIIKEMRNEFTKQLSMRGTDVNVCGIKPRFMVWENVPGAFSSPGLKNGEDHRGEDFQAVLTEIVRVVKANAPDVPIPNDRKWTKSGCLMGIGDNGQPFSVAWRLHDAQFWGVPQRRKRIALVADFGGTSAPEILFECKGVSGNTTESRNEGQRTSTDTERSVDKAIGFQERVGKVGRVKESSYNTIESEHCQRSTNNQFYSSGVVSKGNGECFLTEDKHMSLSVGGGQAGQGYPCVMCSSDREHEHQPCVLQNKAIGVDTYNQTTTGCKTKSITSRATDSDHLPCVLQNKAIGVDSYNLTTTGAISKTVQAERSDNEHIPCVVLEGNGNRPSHQGDGYKESDVSYTPNSTEQHAVCFEPGSMSRVGGHYYEDGKSGTLRANAGDNQQAVCFSQDAYDKYAESEKSSILKHSGGNNGGGARL